MRPSVVAARTLVLAAVSLLAVDGRGVCAADILAADNPEELFELRIRPVLVGVCGRCHVVAEAAGGLRLDSREALLAGGSRGPAVVPGKPEESLLLSAIKQQDERLSMPPEGNAPLDQQTVAAFEQWIAAGAAWPKTPSAEAHCSIGHSSRCEKFSRQTMRNGPAIRLIGL